MSATEGAASSRVAASRYDVLVVCAGGAEALRIATKLDRRCPGVFRVTSCTPVEAEGRLAGSRPACIVLSLPDDYDPLLRLRQLLGARPDTPVVIIGSDDAGLATMLLHEGAQDHLPRSGLGGRVLARALRAAIERSAGELALAHEVLHDDLTGLPNRRLLMDRLGVALRHAARLRLSIPVVFVDLDGFKAINDRLGHDAGDRVLVEVARRLAACVRSADTVARFGGDEFVVLSPDHTAPEEAERLAHRVADAVCEVSYCDGDVILDVAPSIGVALSDGAEPGPEELVRRADAAMYRAKRVPGSSIAFAATDALTPSLSPDTPAELGRALHGGELALHFQPQIDLSTSELAGLEALLRWEHPTRGALTADDFLAQATSKDVADEIERWAIAAACESLAEWAVEVQDVGVSVNLSPRALGAPWLTHTVRRALGRAALDAHRLTLEVTEKALLRLGARAGSRLRALQAIGVRLALDDFGSHHASLALLGGLPLDEIKVDLAHLDGLEDEALRERGRMLEAVMRAAGSLGLDVVAERVETLEQLDRVTTAGCVRAQGYIFGAPEPARHIPSILRARGRGAF